jgi:hypothetical protein
MVDDDIAEILNNCDLAGTFYPKDKAMIKEFIGENNKKEFYSYVDLLAVARMLIKTNL